MESPKSILGSTLQNQRFLLCVLVKRNWDTFVAVKNIAKQLSIDQSRVQFAGIKDAKAITAQHITIEDISMEEALKVDIKDISGSPRWLCARNAVAFLPFRQQFYNKNKFHKEFRKNCGKKHYPNHGRTRLSRWNSKLFWAPTLRNNPTHNTFGWKSHS